MVKVNLTTGEVDRKQIVDDAYTFQVTDAAGVSETLNGKDLKIESIDFDRNTNRLYFGGFSLNANGDKVYSVHARISPKETVLVSALNIGKAVISPKNIFHYVEGSKVPSVYFINVDDGDIYWGEANQSPLKIASFPPDTSMKNGSSNIETMFSQEAVYLFDLTKCTLWRIDRYSGEVRQLYKSDTFSVDSAIAYKGRFYIVGDRAIYELDATGNWKDFVENKQLMVENPFPDSNVPRFEQVYSLKFFAFDKDDNIIFHNGADTYIRKIIR